MAGKHSETNHVNIEDNSGRVYCHKLATIVKLVQAHFTNNCFACPYLLDTAGMKGVECVYYDGTNESFSHWFDAVEAEKNSKMLYHRLGVMTEQEVLDSMDGFDDDQVEEEEEESQIEVEKENVKP